MEIRLDRQLNNCSIIVGPPNFGMIGTIVTEFLIAHLHLPCIGSVVVDGLFPIVAVHNGSVLDPVGLYYDEQRNLLIVHIAANVDARAEAVCDSILELAKRANASCIACVDGVADLGATDVPSVWYVTRNDNLSKQFSSIGMEKLVEGILSDPNAILQSRASPLVASLVASCHSQLPDSAAAASLIAALDEWLHMGVESDQLLSYTAQFEDKWRNILTSSAQSKEEKEKKYVSYVG